MGPYINPTRHQGASHLSQDKHDKAKRFVEQGSFKAFEGEELAAATSQTYVLPICLICHWRAPALMTDNQLVHQV